MISIISPHAAIDTLYETSIAIGDEQQIYLTPISQTSGGKGVNVARILRLLDTKARVLTCIGGYLGYKFKSLCQKDAVKIRYIRTKSETRHNFIFCGQSPKTHHELSAPLTEKDCQAYFDMVIEAAKDSPIIVLNGSLNPGLPSDFYHRIIVRLYQQNPESRFILDMNGRLLRNTLSDLSVPIFMIKINRREWEDWQQTSFSQAAFSTPSKPYHAAGLECVIVTNGDRAIYCLNGTDTSEISSISLSEPPLSTMGSGDAFLGGFLWAFKAKQPINRCLHAGVFAAHSYLTKSPCNKKTLHTALASVTA